MKEWDRLERWITQLVETPFARLFAGRITPEEVAERLVQAMEAEESVHEDGSVVIAGGYRITLNEDDLRALRAAHPQIEATLTAGLEALIRQMNLRLRTPARIVLQSDRTLPPQTIRIAPLREEQGEPTREITHFEETPPASAEPLRAVLILNDGRRTFELTRAEVRIGRAADNDLILDDRSVSRHHALLKQRYRRYLLVDLDSRSGTRLNGLPVREAILRSGDRIEFGAVTALYVEGER